MLRAWIVGSHCYKCNGEDSDIDVVAIVKDTKYYVEGANSISLQNFDLNVYEETCFRRLLRQNVPWAVMCIHANHTEIKPCNGINFSDSFKFELRKLDLKRSVRMEVKQCVEKSNRALKQGNMRGSKKLIVGIVEKTILILTKYSTFLLCRDIV